MTQSRIGFRVLPLVALSLVAPLFCSPATAKEPTPKAPGALSAPLAVRWKFTGVPFGNNPASPVLSDGTLYFASGTRIYAVDAETGTQKWRYPKDTLLTSPVLSTPAISKGTLYFGTGDGLYALDASNGKQRWAPSNAKFGCSTSPIIVDNNVYFGSGDQKIYAVNATSGEPNLTIWSNGKRAGREIGGDFAGNIVATNDTFFFVTGDQVLRAVSINSATLRWAQRLNATAATVTPTLSGDGIYVAIGDMVYGYRVTTGQIRLSFNIANEALTSPAVDGDGNIYAINAERFVISISPRGRPNWKQVPRLEHEPIAPPIIKDGSIFIGTVLGGVYALDAQTGAIKWHYVVQPSSVDNAKIPVATNVSATLVANGNLLYALSDDGALTAFHSTTKKQDSLAPTVTIDEPAQGAYLSGRHPFHISAKVVDEGSGVMSSSVQLLLDGQPIARRASARTFSEKPGFSFDGDTGELEYNILENDTGQRTNLADGHHKLTIVAQDWLGNTASKSWTFFVDDTIRQKTKKKNNTTNGLRGGAGGPGGSKGGGGGGGGG